MEIKINKGFFIKCGIVVLLCVASFCARGFIDARRVSGTSQQLVDGIVLERDTASKLANELNLAGIATASGAELGPAILDGVAELRRASEVGRICTDAIISATQKDAEYIKDLREHSIDYFSATDYAFELAIERAELYESIIRAYDEAQSDNREVNKEPK